MKHYLQDLHIHTEFSCDSEANMQEMCQSAVNLGLPVIGFSDHLDLMPEDPCVGYLQLDQWWESLEACRSKFRDSLIIRAGIEIGEPHRFSSEYDRVLEEYPWDYSLGSLHWVGEDCIFHENYFSRTEEEVYLDYFKELDRMAHQGHFDILAHADVVKRYGYQFCGEYDPAKYEPEIRQVLRSCVERGIVLEINTSTLHWSVGETSPSRPILDWYKQEGGIGVTLGSDAHLPKHVGSGMKEALSSLKAAGINQFVNFSLRERTYLPILPSL